jgi:hypothetical protein
MWPSQSYPPPCKHVADSEVTVMDSATLWCTYRAEPFLRSCQLYCHSGTFQHFMEPEDSSLFTSTLHWSLSWATSI